MSDLMPPPPIMTIREFRKVAGKETDKFSDEQIEEFIAQLDSMAELFIKQVRGRKEKNNEQ